MSERQFARIEFDNPYEWSAREILEALGYAVTRRRRCRLEIRDEDTSTTYRVQLFSRAAEIIKEQLSPRSKNVSVVFQDGYDLMQGKRTMAKEYGFKTVMFPQTYKPTYMDVRSQNLPIEQFESTIAKLEKELEKKGLRNVTHIGRLCRPYARRMPKEELES